MYERLKRVSLPEAAAYPGELMVSCRRPIIGKFDNGLGYPESQNVNSVDIFNEVRFQSIGFDPVWLFGSQAPGQIGSHILDPVGYFLFAA